MGISAVICVCSCEPQTDQYFNFPVEEVSLPDVAGEIHPSKVLAGELMYQNWMVNDSLLLGISAAAYQPEHFLSVSEIRTGKLLGSFCDRGRGPQEYLNPIAADCQDGRVGIYDFMTGRYSELDLEQSLSQGQSVYVRELPMAPAGDEYPALLAIYLWGDRFVAYDNGQSTSSVDFGLSHMPSYVIYGREDGRRIQTLDLYKDLPMDGKRKDRRLVPVKSRLSQVGEFNREQGKLCVAMNYIPQINIVDPESGKARGFRVAERSKLSAKNGFRHYQGIASTATRIYALYWGVEEKLLMDFQGNGLVSELHVFDWDGNFLARYVFSDLISACRAGEDGLYLARPTGMEYELCVIPWTELPDGF